MSSSSRLILFVALGLSGAVTCASASTPAPDVSLNWRSISRLARQNLENKNFKAAESGYEKAIEVLREENPKADEIYGLQLLLVETYREGKNYHKARELLSRMEPAIIAEKYVDPTVAVRFWRRKAEVELSAGFRRLGISYYRKAIAVLEKHFDPNSPTLEKNYLALIPIAAQESDCETITELLNKIRRSKTEADNSASFAVRSGLEVIVQRACKLADNDNYPEAFRLLRAVKGDSLLLPAKSEIWAQFAHHCLTRGDRDEAEKTIPIQLEISEQIKAHLPERQSISLQMKIHGGVATFYSTGGDSKRRQCIHHWEKCLSLSNSLKPPLTTTEYYQRLLVIAALATSREMPLGKATDESIKMLQEPIQFSVLPPNQNFSPADLKGVKEIHINSRICLGWAHLSRNEPVEAEVALSSIDRNVLNEHPAAIGKLLIAGLYLDIAKLYLAKNNKTKFAGAVAAAKELTKGAADCPELTSFWEKYRSVVGVK